MLMTNGGGQTQLPDSHKEAQHKQADPQGINEVMRYFGWNGDKPVSEQNANKHVLDYLQARYNDRGVTITSMLGTFMQNHDAHNVGAVEQLLLREFNIENIEKMETGYFFIETFLADLYEKSNGSLVDNKPEVLNQQQTKQQALAEFWTYNYA